MTDGDTAVQARSLFDATGLRPGALEAAVVAAVVARMIIDHPWILFALRNRLMTPQAHATDTIKVFYDSLSPAGAFISGVRGGCHS